MQWDYQFGLVAVVHLVLNHSLKDESTNPSLYTVYNSNHFV